MLKRLLYLVLLIAFCATSHAAPDDDQEQGQEQSLEPGQLYRYRDDEGSTVMDYSLPPGVAEKGYQILSPTGRVVKTVPPASELKEKAREEKEEEVDEEQQREDAYIQRSYKSVEEVEQARERRLKQIRQEIAILEANLAEFQRRAKELREKAANYQASGKEPPASVLRVLGDLEEQQEGVLEQIAEREMQYREAQVRFERYVRRLRVLAGDDDGQNAEGSDESGDSRN